MSRIIKSQGMKYIIYISCFYICLKWRIEKQENFQFFVQFNFQTLKTKLSKLFRVQTFNKSKRLWDALFHILPFSTFLAMTSFLRENDCVMYTHSIHTTQQTLCRRRKCYSCWRRRCCCLWFCDCDWLKYDGIHLPSLVSFFLLPLSRYDYDSNLLGI